MKNFHIMLFLLSLMVFSCNTNVEGVLESAVRDEKNLNNTDSECKLYKWSDGTSRENPCPGGMFSYDHPDCEGSHICCFIEIIIWAGMKAELDEAILSGATSNFFLENKEFFGSFYSANQMDNLTSGFFNIELVANDDNKYFYAVFPSNGTVNDAVKILPFQVSD